MIFDCKQRVVKYKFGVNISSIVVPLNVLACIIHHKPKDFAYSNFIANPKNTDVCYVVTENNKADYINKGFSHTTYIYDN